MHHQLRKQKLMASLAYGKVLDVGFATLPNKYLTEPIGIDIQKVKKPENYKAVYRLNLNFQSLPFSNNSFDTIILGDVIEHVENPSFLLRECNRVLRGGGS